MITQNMLEEPWAPLVYASWDGRRRVLQVSCHCSWQERVKDGSSIWQLLMTWARHLSEVHPDQDLAMAVQLAGVLRPQADSEADRIRLVVTHG